MDVEPIPGILSMRWEYASPKPKSNHAKIDSGIKLAHDVRFGLTHGVVLIKGEGAGISDEDCVSVVHVVEHGKNYIKETLGTIRAHAVALNRKLEL